MTNDLSASNPIGIFDSGIGGLTVARALANELPNEDIIYFGDTAHLPYGDKSTAAIQAYSVKISHFLLSQGVKMILIACNSASAAAYDLVREYVGTNALVMNVIDPVVDFVAAGFAGKRVGLIGTKQTILSGVFERKLAGKNAGIELRSLATPLLAPMIEEGFFNNRISLGVIEEYLRNPMLEGIEALILGCTHYPLIAKEIDAFFQGKVHIIDSAVLVSRAVHTRLESLQLCHGPHEVKTRFYVSDFTQAFENSTQIFFSDRVSLEPYALW
jgi:glutamate racemase